MPPNLTQRERDNIHKMARIRDVLGMAGNAFVDQMGLCQIVVIGNQSSGKSSLLERIACLPENSNLFPVDVGTCTRNPISLRLISSTEETLQVSVQYGDGPKKEHIQIDQVARTISDLATRHNTPGICFSDVEIKVEIRSRSVADLTLVDLPGFFNIHNPQLFQVREDVENVKNIALRYVSQPNSIVVGVLDSSAEWAQNGVNPFYLYHCGEKYNYAPALLEKKTLFVFNKLDLAGPRASEIQTHFATNLGLGTYGTICRQANYRLSREKEGELLEALQAHESIFKSPSFQDKLGIAALINVLQSHLSQEIDKNMVSVMRNLEAALAIVERQIAELGLAPNHSLEALHHICDQFLQNVGAVLRGDMDAAVVADLSGMGDDRERSELYGMPKVREEVVEIQLLTEIYRAYNQAAQYIAYLGEVDIGNIIKMAGTGPSANSRGDAPLISLIELVYKNAQQGAESDTTAGSPRYKSLKFICHSIVKKYCNAMNQYVFPLCTMNVPLLSPECIDIKERYPNLYSSLANAFGKALDDLKKPTLEFLDQFMEVLIADIDVNVLHHEPASTYLTKKIQDMQKPSGALAQGPIDVQRGGAPSSIPAPLTRSLTSEIDPTRAKAGGGLGRIFGEINERLLHMKTCAESSKLTDLQPAFNRKLHIGVIPSQLRTALIEAVQRVSVSQPGQDEILKIKSLKDHLREVDELELWQEKGCLQGPKPAFYMFGDYVRRHDFSIRDNQIDFVEAVLAVRENLQSLVHLLNIRDPVSEVNRKRAQKMKEDCLHYVRYLLDRQMSTISQTLRCMIHNALQTPIKANYLRNNIQDLRDHIQELILRPCEENPELLEQLFTQPEDQQEREVRRQELLIKRDALMTALRVMKEPFSRHC